MAIYRFRVEVEDLDGVFREIEIKSTQTFEDLHLAILKSYAFDFKHPASFFYSDDLWHTEDEIAFNFESAVAMSNAQAMNKARISEFVEDPHQRFLYVYFSEDETFTFHIELMDIITADRPASGLPAMVKSVGDAPKQYKSRISFKPKKDEGPAVLAEPVLEDLEDVEDVVADTGLEVFESFDTVKKSKPDEDLGLDDLLEEEEEEKDEFDNDEDEDTEEDGDSDDDFGSGYGKGRGRGRSSDYDDDY